MTFVVKENLEFVAIKDLSVNVNQRYANNQYCDAGRNLVTSTATYLLNTHQNLSDLQTEEFTSVFKQLSNKLTSCLE